MGYREADTFTPAARHAARIRQSANQNLSGGDFNNLDDGAEIEDTDTYFNPAAPDRFTIPAGLDGLYLATHNADISIVTPDAGAAWLLNFVAPFLGGQVMGVAAAAPVSLLSAGMIRSLAAGDVLEPHSIAIHGGVGAVSSNGGTNGRPTFEAIVKLDT